MQNAQTLGRETSQNLTEAWVARYRADTSQLDRVREMTATNVRERLDREVEGEIAFYSEQPDGIISRRLSELEREWDVDRALMLNFGIIGGVTLLSGLLKNRRLLYMLGVQLSFLTLHSFRGWCPPLPLLRRLGFRTQKEIQAERYVLEAILASRKIAS